MNALLGLSRLIDRVNEGIGKVAGYAILLAIFISAGNAVIRKLSPQLSSNAWLEAQWYLFGTAFLLSAALVLKQNEHIRIDLVFTTLKRRTQHWIDLFGHVFFLLPLCLMMMYFLVPYVQRSYRSGEMSINSGGLIVWPAKALLLACFVMLTAQCLSEIIKKIAVMRGVIDDPTPYVSSHDAATAEAEALIEEIKK